MTITIGADPEIFLGNLDGVPASAENVIPGVKEHPHQIDDIQIMIDNVAAEFAIPPCENSASFIDKVEKGKGLLELFATGNDMKLLMDISTLFPEDQLQSAVAQTFGCDPDLNVYGEPERKPVHPRLRSVGGHVHLGADIAQAYPIEVVKLFDLILGVPFFYFDKEWNRASLYGKMGTYRIKPYGVEYRTLSNSWIWNKHLAEVVYDRARFIGTISSRERLVAIIADARNHMFNCIGTTPDTIYEKQVLNDSSRVFADTYYEYLNYDIRICRYFGFKRLYRNNW